MNANSPYRTKFFDVIFKEGKFENLITKEWWNILVLNNLNTFMDNLCRSYLDKYIEDTIKGNWHDLLNTPFTETKKVVIEEAKKQIAIIKQNPIFVLYEKKIAS